jgi:Phytoene dehydrogenase and related proteins
MPNRVSYDAVVVGSGPNGLAAAIRLAQEKLSVLVLEANDTIGGGTRSAELTLPGFTHDLCSAVHPLGIGSPFFRELPLERYGLHWMQPEFPLAHPVEGEIAAVLQRSLEKTAAGLGADQVSYARLMSPLVEQADNLSAEFLQPILHRPKHPVLLARFGLEAFRSACGLVNKKFTGASARALFAGLAAHSFMRLEDVPSAAIGLVLGMLAHAAGWPLARGGSQRIADALAAHLRYLGGEIQTGFRVEHLDQLPLARATLFDLTPLQLVLLMEEKLPDSYRRRLGRFRYGPGVFKVDYALNAAIPWRNESCRRAGTVHVGGSFEEIAAAERKVVEGKIPDRPFLLLAQPTVVDPTRAPAGKHILWAYCHVPNGSRFDMTERMENQIERFAPGFRGCILARHTMNCEAMEAKNSNLVGGDINGGAFDLRQLVARPIFSATPYRIPVPGYYLCSSSTPPGGGVHGMCGFYAAEAALHDCFR